MNWKHWASFIGSTFIGAGAGFLQAQLAGGIPTTGAKWSAAGIGAMVCGVIAVAHLFQPAPVKS